MNDQATIDILAKLEEIQDDGKLIALAKAFGAEKRNRRTALEYLADQSPEELATALEALAEETSGDAPLPPPPPPPPAPPAAPPVEAPAASVEPPAPPAAPTPPVAPSRGASGHPARLPAALPGAEELAAREAQVEKRRPKVQTVEEYLAYVVQRDKGPTVTVTPEGDVTFTWNRDITLKAEKPYRVPTSMLDTIKLAADYAKVRVNVAR